MRRKMTAVEKKRFKGYFPDLDVERAVVSGGRTSKYNCISWTIGVTRRWIWPGSNIQDFDKFYASHGCIRSSYGPIAIWGHNPSNMSHGCISGPDHGPRWESKCGGDLRIQHGLNELVGGSYGQVLAFYNREIDFVKESVAIYEPRDIFGLKGVQQVKHKKTEAKRILESVIKEMDRQTISEFEARFSTWAKTWHSPYTAHLSNPAFVKDNEEFVELLKMGTGILPLVVEKLTDPKNFFALQLYDSLQLKGEKAMIVHIDPEDDTMMEGEQGRAARTVEQWVSRL